MIDFKLQYNTIQYNTIQYNAILVIILVIAISHSLLVIAKLLLVADYKSIMIGNFKAAHLAV